MSGGQERMGGRGGHDAAIFSREEDHLDRWPFAREIYGVATTGPKEWSVRIGVYGEWGSGKTSVINLAKNMADADGHVTVSFNPWQYTFKDELWREFVQSVYSRLQRIPECVSKARCKRLKAAVAKNRGLIPAAVKCFYNPAGEVVSGGLSLIRHLFAFSETDLAGLSKALGEKRVIVFVDDLDRTAPELVPEILFALKELMNVPGFSFICAFDPEVVSHVLGRYHPGFGEGLKFLDKIIDYPRWLPIPSWEGLTNLAVAETSRLCQFVPVSAVKDAVGLLPANPRAVRQFIRLISLMRPQIERHNDDELIWPIILSAAVIKVRFPRLALGLLKSGKFWAEVASEWESDEQQAREKVRGVIDKHISNVLKTFTGTDQHPEKNLMQDALLALAPHVEAWTGVGFEVLAYQMHVAEEPRAVTMKEFGEFWMEFRSNHSAEFAKNWLEDHSKRVDRSERDVFRDLIRAAVKYRDSVFRRIGYAHQAVELAPLRHEAEDIVGLLEVLVLKLGHLDQSEKWLDPTDFNRICEAILERHDDSVSDADKGLREREGQFLRQIVTRWSPDILPIIKVLNPDTSRLYFHLQAERAKKLCRELSQIARDKYAIQLTGGLREADFITRLFRRSDDSRQAVRILLDVDGPLWKEHRKEALGVLAGSARSVGVQRSAYDLVYWFCSALRTKTDPWETDNLKKLFAEQEIRDALWSAATATPLAPKKVLWIQDFPTRCEAMGANVALPSWWDAALAQAKRSNEKEERSGE